MANDTVLFKHAVGEYVDFIQTPQFVEMLKHIKLYKRESGAAVLIPNNPADTDSPFIDCYRILLRRYRNWQILYINVGDFLDTLIERIEIHLPNYWIQKTFLDQLFLLDDKSLMSQGYQVQNFVDHTDTEVTDSLNTILEQLTNQTVSKGTSSYPSMIRSQIANLRYTLQEDFLRKFRSLFSCFGSVTNYYG